MVRIASERIAVLFALAAKEASGPSPGLADRYVTLARRIGMRYNVRMPPEYSETYCRGCCAYWIEGRSVRTRLRGGYRVRTCLGCGRERRVWYGPRGLSRSPKATRRPLTGRPADQRGTSRPSAPGAEPEETDPKGG